MALIERTAYPRFAPRPSAAELDRLYTPTLRELDLARRTTRGGEDRQLAFLVMLKSFQRLGYFPKPEEVPEAVVSHLRLRLGVAQDAPPRSRQCYRDAIRGHLRARPHGDDARRVTAEAVAEAALTMDDPADLVNVAIEELVKERFELPAFSALDRLARKVRYAVDSRLFSRVDGALSRADRARLDSLLVADARGRSDLNLLKAAPKSATQKNLSGLQESLLWMESFGDTKGLLSGIPDQKVAHLAAQARALDASELRKVGEGRRRAMLVSLIHRAKVAARDGLAEMLVKTVGRANAGAKGKLEDLHRERRATTEALVAVLERILVGAQGGGADDAALGRRVRALLAEGGPEALLAAAVSLSAHRGGSHLPLLWGFYKGQRATLFRVARSLSFRPTTEDRSLVGALRFVLEADRLGRRGEFLEGELDLSFASERWRELVVADLGDGRPMLARRHLEACVFSSLAQELKTGDLSVEGSDGYADYRKQLLSWEESAPLAEGHCRELGLEPTPGGFVAQLEDKLSKTAREVDRLYPENAAWR